MKNPKIITAIRHAPTNHNQKQIIAGRKDVPLSDDGRHFVKRFVKERGSMTAEKIYSSPLQRASETASILFDVPRETLNLEPLCIERNYGAMEEASRAEIEAMNISYTEVNGISHSLNPPDGETFEEVRERANQFLNILLKDTAKDIAFVAHQTFLKQFLGLLQGLNIHDSLGIDIHPLAMRRFTLVDSEVADQSELFEGVTYIKSW